METDRPAFPTVVDATLLSAWRSCHRKAFLSYIDHWKPQGEQVHLHAGAAFARGLEVARRAFYAQDNIPVGELPALEEHALVQGAQALAEAYGDFEPPEGVNKTLDRMIGALAFYFQQWPLASDPARPHIFPSGQPGIEFSFATPLPFAHPVSGDPIIYAGRSDMICDFAGGLYIENDKTASQLGASWSKQWDLRSQFTGYCWAAGEAGLEVNGVLVRGVSILKTKYDKAEAITYRPKWQIARWLVQVQHDLADMQRAWETGYWDFSLDHACDEYGGCSFKQICTSPDPDTWLPVYFERRVWNPLTRTETPLETQDATA